MLGLFRTIGYGWIALQGLLAALLPKQLINLSTRLSLCGFENAAELEPKPWYVDAMRAAGVGMVAAGLTGLLLERDSEETDEPEVAVDAPASDDA
ncbi:hypothetical protein HLRTI_001048 [Halorhabdus tiamatea SARL4B]|nr:hypothetical protein [Halorhabdus tiamatea]ERJ06970.1 hypothetical protein HLRTI_001048 [Halorhabdus tiamatea SARL4B]